jgi:hypothetical protein
VRGVAVPEHEVVEDSVWVGDAEEEHLENEE